MADKPIPFSAPMVRAILREIEAPGTGKTQHRVILADAPQYSRSCPRPRALRRIEIRDDDDLIPFRRRPEKDDQ